jgi:hypothetical protein
MSPEQPQEAVPEQEPEQPTRKPSIEHRRARRRIEAVASQLYESLIDRGADETRLDALRSLWRASERTIEHIEEWMAWAETSKGQEDLPTAELFRLHLQPAAASLLDLAATVGAMRRDEE